ncbi:hypothetical protein R1sor_024148 [Riccia sorocarpa]|uniref:Uncharacterized protein n=1 Tax=Riccia sorocarpa TaxID=122646 RepID=A0ABD3GRV6_9MARC
MAPASKRLVSKSPVLMELFAEHHYDSEKGHYTQAGNDGGTNWSDNDNIEETASLEKLGSKDIEDMDSSEDDIARGHPMRRMGCTEEAEIGSIDAEDSLLDLSPPAHAFLTLPSNKSDGLPALQKGQGMHRHQTGSVTSPAKRTKKTSPVTVACLQARFRPLRDQEQPQDKSPTRILTTEVLELSSDDSHIHKATPPMKFHAKDLCVDVLDDDISWL